MRYLLLLTDAEPDNVRSEGYDITVVPTEAGPLLVTFPDDSDDADLLVGPHDKPVRLLANTLLGLTGSSPDDAPTLAVPGARQPPPTTFASRASRLFAGEEVEDASGVAGVPGQDAMPISAVAEKHSASYVFTSEALGTQNCVKGELRQIDTFWEPLGWALDEWIDTLSLAPFEDTVDSSISGVGEGTRDDAERADLADVLRSSAANSVSSAEAMQAAMTGSTDSRNRQASLKGPGEGGGGNPLVALARGVLGSFQFDFGRAQTTVTSSADADLTRDVMSLLEQATTRERTASNNSLAHTASTWRESRRLRALRNLGPGSAQNLALFSVARQWSVTAVEAPKRRILLIKAHEADRAFDHRDVFEHRAVLSSGLLDPSLADTLERVAGQYEPEPEAEPQAWPTVERVTGTFAINDAAEGYESKIKLDARFRLDDGSERRSSVAFEAKGARQVSFVLPDVNQPLDRLVGWRFEFENPGPIDLDVFAQLDPIEILLHVSDGVVVPVSFGGAISLYADVPQKYPAGFVLRKPRRQTRELTRDASRLLIHLNEHRPYYRLLIDLLTDPATRAVRLAQREPATPMPADLQPVAVAGVHLAFLADQKTKESRNSKAPEPAQILSTPAGGTFLDVLAGTGTVTTEHSITEWPTVALADKTVTWPAPADERTVVRAAAAKEDAPPTTKEPSPAGESELVAKVEALMKSFEPFKALLDAAKEQSSGAAKPKEQEQPKEETAKEEK